MILKELSMAPWQCFLNPPNHRNTQNSEEILDLLLEENCKVFKHLKNILRNQNSILLIHEMCGQCAVHKSADFIYSDDLLI